MLNIAIHQQFSFFCSHSSIATRHCRLIAVVVASCRPIHIILFNNESIAVEPATPDVRTMKDTL